MQEHFVDYFIFLSNSSFSAILDKTQFERTKLAHVLNADTITSNIISMFTLPI